MSPFALGVGCCCQCTAADVCCTGGVPAEWDVIFGANVFSAGTPPEEERAIGLAASFNGQTFTLSNISCPTCASVSGTGDFATGTYRYGIQCPDLTDRVSGLPITSWLTLDIICGNTCGVCYPPNKYCEATLWGCWFLEDGGAGTPLAIDNRWFKRFMDGALQPEFLDCTSDIAFTSVSSAHDSPYFFFLDGSSPLDVKFVEH